MPVVHVHQRPEHIRKARQAFDHSSLWLEAPHQRGTKLFVKSNIERLKVASDVGLKSPACAVPIHEHDDDWTAVFLASAAIGFNQMNQHIIDRPTAVQHFNAAAEA